MGPPDLRALLDAALAKHNAGDLDGARPLYARLLAAAPMPNPALGLLGILEVQAGNEAKAEPLLRAAVQAAPDDGQAGFALAELYRRAGRNAEAEAAYRAVLRHAPDHPIALHNLSGLLLLRGAVDEAEELVRKALTVKPDYPLAWNTFAVTQLYRDTLDEVAQALDEAERLQPGRFDTRHNRVHLHKLLGEAGAAVRLSRDLSLLTPDNSELERQRLNLLLGDPNASLEDLAEAHRAFAATLRRLAPAPLPDAGPGSGGPRLRVGLVSSDFRDHPITRNLIPILSRFDRDRTEVRLYTLKDNSDSLSERMCRQADGWRSLDGLNDAAAAAVLRRDGLDVMVLLGSHFDSNRPALALYRPAPLIVSFHDPATSGLAEVDALIADPVLVPPHGREWFAERVVRLPSFYHHGPLEFSPDIPPLPSLRNGWITFGAFNAPSKINDRVLALWRRVLEAVPDSRLLFKYRAIYRNGLLRKRIKAAFDGIDPQRLIFAHGRDHLDKHLLRLAEADIALDTFPFSGSTTTFDSLWMGLPVVTLPGETMVSRWSAAMLIGLGHPELIARSPEDYIALASALAGDRDRLDALRGSLRGTLAASPLCDMDLRARQIERLLHALAAFKKRHGSVTG